MFYERVNVPWYMPGETAIFVCKSSLCLDLKVFFQILFQHYPQLWGIPGGAL